MSTEIINLCYKDKREEELCSSDTTICYGYATDETPELHPQSHLLANRLTDKLTEVRKAKVLPYLRPDGKITVTMEYKTNVTDDKSVAPLRVHSIFVSTQHDSDVTFEELKAGIIEQVIKPVVPKELVDSNTQYLVNPKGTFINGGPEMDTGVTGKKIAVDTYGGWGSNGGNKHIFIIIHNY